MSVTATEARHAIAGIIYKPGWEFRVVADYWYRIDLHESVMPGWFPNYLNVEVTYPAPNSNIENARRGYTEPLLHGALALIVVNLTLCETVDDVLGRVMAGVFGIEIHEAREFFRLRQRGLCAPWHPHRADGAAAYSEGIARYGFPAVMG